MQNGDLKQCKYARYQYDLEDHEFFVSRDVVFKEDTFPYLDDNIEPARSDELPVFHDLGVFHEEPLVVESKGSVDDAIVEPSEIPGASMVGERVVELGAETEKVTLVVPTTETGVAEPVQEEQMLGRGHRVSQPSVKLKDYVTYNAKCLIDKHNATPISPTTTPRSSDSVQGKRPIHSPHMLLMLCFHRNIKCSLQSSQREQNRRALKKLCWIPTSKKQCQ